MRSCVQCRISFATIGVHSGYENSLSGSERFGEYDEALTAALIERYQLRDRLIVEVGCGRGQFLRALCERGGNSGVGFDPSYSQDEDTPELQNLVIYPEVYGARRRKVNADLICSRHTLEHVEDPRGFLFSIRTAMARTGTPVFFELPNGLYTFCDGGIWDIIYEHCSYFTPSSLTRAFCETGYRPVEVAETFAGQFLTIHAMSDGFVLATYTSVSLGLETLLKSFAQVYQSKLMDWAGKLLKLESGCCKVVIWGAGAKAATFLNLLHPGFVRLCSRCQPTQLRKIHGRDRAANRATGVLM